LNDDLVRLYTKLDDMTHALVLCYACLTGEAAQFAGGMEASVREAKTLARKALAGTHHRSKKALLDSGVPERDKVLHVDQAAAILGIARSTLMNRIKQDNAEIKQQEKELTETRKIIDTYQRNIKEIEGDMKDKKKDGDDMQKYEILY